jgi:O-acetylhomoserine (thiol)-lyase
MAEQGIGTICVQGGYTPGNGEPRQVPIVQSTTFKYATGDEMGKLFDLASDGYFYTRLANPTNDTVARKICALEGGTAAMLTASGMSAVLLALVNLVGAGDHIVSSASIYGGSFNLMSVTLKRMGVESTFLSPDSTAEEIAAAIRPNTKLLYGETIANPALSVLDIEKWATVAHDHGLPLIVDNTFATPVNCRPIEFGADIVTHSTTKYMDGHGVAVGGALVDSGNFPWADWPDRFPGLCTPDESYHGLVYTQAFGKGAFITKAVSQVMRDFGAQQGPQNAFYLNLGLQSLHVRMKRHCESALQVARFLQGHPDVAWVRSPGLESDPYYAPAQKYMPGGTCGVMCIGPKGGRDFDNRFMDALRLITIETHVADCYSCILHPASHTHRQLSDEQLREAGIDPGLMRLSIGLEDVADIIDDLDQALRAAH